ncbi:hypothetical protein GWI33_014280 [Rhynchophorus ferrugineus]|uniref:Uncharacterized protein n=1 Tax=Rhynchophorus ferrugineus TaxID=354439 RepID=A0A834I1Z9_RHYFE|nr:hypothetical protein GWI33_014280 [Rhynchophorus ferrugineus]
MGKFPNKLDKSPKPGRATKRSFPPTKLIIFPYPRDPGGEDDDDDDDEDSASSKQAPGDHCSIHEPNERKT